MTHDRRTRAELLTELAVAQQRITAATEREQSRDLEARAFDDCTRILGHLEQLSRPTVSSNRAVGYDLANRMTAPGLPTAPVGRVLDYLRVRFGLPDPAIEAHRLAVRLADAEAERDRLRVQLANVTSAASQPVQQTWLP